MVFCCCCCLGGSFLTDTEENLNNTDNILNAAEGASNAVLMGDMNHSPGVASTGVDALFPSNYDTVLRRNFCSPYANRRDANCTFCESNPFNSVENKMENTIVDHIFVRVNNRCPNSSARVSDIVCVLFCLSLKYMIIVCCVYRLLLLSG